MVDTEQRLKRLENQVSALVLVLKVVTKVVFKLCNWTSAPEAEELLPHLRALEDLSPRKSPR